MADKPEDKKTADKPDKPAKKPADKSKAQTESQYIVLTQITGIKDSETSEPLEVWTPVLNRKTMETEVFFGKSQKQALDAAQETLDIQPGVAHTLRAVSLSAWTGSRTIRAEQKVVLDASEGE